LLDRFQRLVFLLRELARNLLSERADDERVQVLFDLLWHAEQVVAADAQMLVMETASSLQQAVVLRQLGRLGEDRFKEQATRDLVK
jgi:hypothetical protein